MHKRFKTIKEKNYGKRKRYSEKQTFQCVKKIKFIPGQHYFKTDVFLDLCSNVDEYYIVDSVDEIPPRGRDSVLYCRSGPELYRVPPKNERHLCSALGG